MNLIRNLGSVIEIFSVWYDSILKGHNKEDTRWPGVLTNETTGVFFGVSPGFPQLLVKVSNDLKTNGALFEHLNITFDSYESDNEGRIKPNNIRFSFPQIPKKRG